MSSISLITPQSSPTIIQGWYNRAINSRSNSGFGLTPVPQINKKEQDLVGDNIKMDLREVGWDVGWFNVAQDRSQRRSLLNTLM
jgi:hypothetical protein